MSVHPCAEFREAVDELKRTLQSEPFRALETLLVWLTPRVVRLGLAWFEPPPKLPGYADVWFLGVYRVWSVGPSASKEQAKRALTRFGRLTCVLRYRPFE